MERRKKNTTARVILESLSLSLDVCPKLESSTTTLRVVGAKKYGSLSLLRTKRERLKCMCTDEKRTCDTAFVCHKSALLSAENLPKSVSFVVVIRRRKKKKKKKKKNEETRDERERRRRSNGGKRRLRGESAALCNATFVN